MNRFSKLRRSLAIVFFSCGILVDMLFFALLSWPGLEAYDYFNYQPAGAALTSLKCPFVLTPHDSGQVTARFSNPTRLTLTPQFRVLISSPDLFFRTVNSVPSVAPDETSHLQWAISSDDVVYGRLILVEAYQSPVYGMTDRAGQCGTLWLGVPQLTGAQIFFSVLAAGLLLTGLGWGLWLAGNRSNPAGRPEDRRPMLAISAVVLSGMVAGIVGLWVVGVLCLVLSLLLILSVLGHLAISRG